MLRTAVGTLLVLALLVAGSGPVAATSQPAMDRSVGSATGSNPALGAASPQVAGTCSFPVSSTDATGTNVTVGSEPKTVVALGASTAQTLWDIGAKEEVVGMPVDSTTAALNGSRDRTGIFQSDGFTVATERVVGLDADLVLAANVIPNATVEKLRNAGMTVYKFGAADSFADIYTKTNRTGRLVGACDGAATTVANTKARVNAVERAVAGTDRPRVLYQQSGGFVAGNGTFIGNVLQSAGAENLAASAGIQSYQKISNEVVASRSPQWIVTSNRSYIPDNDAYASTPAVAQNRTIVVDGNYISQPAPRVVIPLERIAGELHPEAMQAANLSTTPNGSTALGMGNATTQSTTGSNATGTTPETMTTTGGESTTAREITASGETAVGGATSDTETTVSGMATGGSNATAAETGQIGNASGVNGSTETTSSNGPGFGVAGAALALLGATLLARRRH